MTKRLLPCLALALSVLPSIGQAQARPVIQQRVVGLLNPMGVEHSVGVAARARLGDPDELLFTGAHAEAGFVNYTSPIYTMNAGYLEVSPLAILMLRAEIAQTHVWPIGLGGAGYYGASQDRMPALDPEAGREASGWNVRLSAVLQAAFDVGPLRLVLWNEASAEHVRLGEARFHYSARHDAVLARDDWVLGDWGMAMLEVPLGDGLVARLGLYDEVRAVPRSGWLSNQAGLVAMLAAERPVPEVGWVLPFLRAGIYTHHERRAGEPTLLAGVMVRYEIMPERGRRVF